MEGRMRVWMGDLILGVFFRKHTNKGFIFISGAWL